MGVAKNNKGDGLGGGRRMQKMNWIDLFNIGNVMLMRGQDIQMSHQGWNETGEFTHISDVIALESNPESPRTMSKTGGNSGILSGNGTSRLETH